MKTTLHSAGETLIVEYTQSGDEYAATINGHSMHVRLLSIRDGAVTLLINGKPLHLHIAGDSARALVAIEGQTYEFTQAQAQRPRTRQREARGLDPEVRSPMPGKILEVLVSQGSTVEVGQALILLEAMKMENTLVAEGNARVKKIHVAPGDLVDLGQLLVELEFVEQGEVKPS